MDPVSGAILCAAIAGACSIAVALITRPDRKKLEETHHQTTQNGGKNSPPTIPDQLHILDDKLDKLIERFDGHIEWHLEQK
jgi:hypothetical protein